ncbi:dihydrolipoamide succinyltransferase [Pelomyxa schiedti]|nr:dihydrolipoamide succinyltransferase [Pelomyxa schiedti]
MSTNGAVVTVTVTGTTVGQMAQPQTPQQHTLNDKESFQDYVMLEIIGKGSFGVVFKSLRKTKGDFVAIKKLSRRFHSESLMTEIDTLRCMAHKNVVKYIEHLSSDTHIYIVMEYIENGSLSSIVKRYGILPENIVCTYVSQVLEGLAYLHEQGVIHRDIKGANLLLTTKGTVKLSDFGVAMRQNTLSKAATEDIIAGTPCWMAPEVVQMQTPTSACDIWSLGSTIIELLTGDPPYHDCPMQAAMYRIVMDDHPPFPSNISLAMEDFLLHCFKKDENLRLPADQLILHPWICHNIRNKKADIDISQMTQEILDYNQLSGKESGMRKKDPPSKSSPATATSMSTKKPTKVKTPSSSRSNLRASGSSGSKDQLLARPNAPSVPSAWAPVELASDSEDDWDDFDEPVAITMSPVHHTVVSNPAIDDNDDWDGLVVSPSNKLDSGTPSTGTLKLRLKEMPAMDDEPDWDDDMGSAEQTRVVRRDRLVNQIMDQIAALRSSDCELTLKACNTLSDLFESNPAEVYLLISTGPIAGVYPIKLEDQVPIIPILSTLQQTPTPSLRGQHDRVVCGLLHLLNTCVRIHKETLSAICLLGGIPIISALAMNGSMAVKTEAASFVSQLCTSKNTLKLFLSCGGPEVLCSLLLCNLHTEKDIVSHAIDCICSVFKLPASTPKSALCQIFIKYNFTATLFQILHQIFTDHLEENLRLANKVVDLLFFFSSFNAVVKATFCTDSNLTTLVKLLGFPNATILDQRNFLLKLMKVTQNLSADPVTRESLACVIETVVLLLRLNDPTIDKVWELHNQALHILYNLCNLNSTNLTRAAAAGLIPCLHSTITVNSPLKELALQLLFKLLWASPQSREMLWENNSFEQYLQLILDKNWYGDACDCVAGWLNHDSNRIRPLIESSSHVNIFKSAFEIHGPKKYFSKVLTPLQNIISSCPGLAEGLINAGTIPVVCSLLANPNPFSRVTLLKILLILLNCAKSKSPQPQEPVTGTPATEKPAPTPPPSPSLISTSVISQLSSFIPATTLQQLQTTVTELATDDCSYLVRGIAVQVLSVLGLPPPSPKAPIPSPSPSLSRSTTPSPTPSQSTNSSYSSSSYSSSSFDDFLDPEDT